MVRYDLLFIPAAYHTWIKGGSSAFCKTIRSEISTQDWQEHTFSMPTMSEVLPKHLLEIPIEQDSRYSHRYYSLLCWFNTTTQLVAAPFAFIVFWFLFSARPLYVVYTAAVDWIWFSLLPVLADFVPEPIIFGFTQNETDMMS